MRTIGYPIEVVSSEIIEITVTLYGLSELYLYIMHKVIGSITSFLS